MLLLHQAIQERRARDAIRREVRARRVLRARWRYSTTLLSGIADACGRKCERSHHGTRGRGPGRPTATPRGRYDVGGHGGEAGPSASHYVSSDFFCRGGAFCRASSNGRSLRGPALVLSWLSVRLQDRILAGHGSGVDIVSRLEIIADAWASLVAVGVGGWGSATAMLECSPRYTVDWKS